MVRKMEQSIFDEVEHWLEFIRVWERENSGNVPYEVIDALEKSLEKVVLYYRENNNVVHESDYFH